MEIESEEELDALLAAEPGTLTVLLASLTWCRPCKSLAKPLQACPPLLHLHAPGAAPATAWPSRCWHGSHPVLSKSPRLYSSHSDSLINP
jgi:hypothetical protein